MVSCLGKVANSRSHLCGEQENDPARRRAPWNGIFHAILALVQDERLFVGSTAMPELEISAKVEQQRYPEVVVSDITATTGPPPQREDEGAGAGVRKQRRLK